MGTPWVEPVSFITPLASGVKDTWYTSKWGTLSKLVPVPKIGPLKTYSKNIWGNESGLIPISASSPRNGVETMVRIETPSISVFLPDELGLKNIRTADWIGGHVTDQLSIIGSPIEATVWRAANAPYAKIPVARPSLVKKIDGGNTRVWGDAGTSVKGLLENIALRDSSRWRQPQLTYQVLPIKTGQKIKTFDQLRSGFPSEKAFILGNKKPVRYQIPAAPPTPITNVTWAVNGYFSVAKSIAVQPTNKFTWGF